MVNIYSKSRNYNWNLVQKRVITYPFLNVTFDDERQTILYFISYLLVYLIPNSHFIEQSTKGHINISIASNKGLKSVIFIVRRPVMFV